MRNEKVNEEKEAEIYREGREFGGGYDGFEWQGRIAQSIPFETSLFRGFHYMRSTRGYFGARSDTEIGLAYWPTTENGEKLDLQIAGNLPLGFSDKHRIHLRVIDPKLVKIGLSKIEKEVPEVEYEIPLKTLDEKIKTFGERKGEEPDQYTICAILRDTLSDQR